jgi:hypothetical protein
MPPLIHREPYQQALFTKYPTVQDVLPSQQSQNSYKEEPLIIGSEPEDIDNDVYE